jgi:hypothetical protein
MDGATGNVTSTLACGAVISRESFPRLIDVLQARGYQVVGPTIREGAIVYGVLNSVADLPEGWTDEQGGGTYRLKRRPDAALFGYGVGPHSWKQFLFPAASRLCRIKRGVKGLESLGDDEAAPRRAFLGVRACDLEALATQDRVFLGGRFVDPTYQRRRAEVFVVAVNCGQAGGTCFCVSMNAGPKATSGFDLALTEIVQDGHHEFVVETGTAQGVEVLRDVPHRPAGAEDLQAAAGLVAQAGRQMGRVLDTAGLKELLYRNHEHPHWDDVAARCLTCANCTMVCPTCFCSTVEDVTDLCGEQAERWRRWDSCFTLDFSYIHGGSVRASPKARYRQWLTHKLATWFDQFGRSGCVGCGRCITWCPVGIDITEEASAIRRTDGVTMRKELL